MDERAFPLISVDYMFLYPKGILLKDEVKSSWENPPEGCVRVLAGMCSGTESLLRVPYPRRARTLTGTPQRVYQTVSLVWATLQWP